MDARNYLSNNVNVNMVKNSPSKILVILNEGIEKAGQDGIKRLNFLVEMDKQAKNYLPNSSSMEGMIAAWTYDTKKWIGKKVYLEVKMMRGREAILGKPIKEEEPKAGTFGEDIPVPNICAKCDAKITDAEKSYSIKAFHRTLCYNCQKLQKGG